MTAEEKLARKRELARLRQARFRARNPRKATSGLMTLVEAQRSLIASQNAVIQALEASLALRNGTGKD